MSTIDSSDHDPRDVVDCYRVVVVMASFDVAITLKRLLEMLGYAAEIATDGQAALELVILNAARRGDLGNRACRAQWIRTRFSNSQ